MNLREAGGERFRAVVAVHLFLLSGGEILLSRRFNTGYSDGQYSVVAGHLDGDEEVRAAMIREAREEAGVVIEPDDLGFAGVMHRRAEDERIDFFFAATTWHGEICNCEPEKCDQLDWFPLDRLPVNVVPYVRCAIENYRKGRLLDSYGWD